MVFFASFRPGHIPPEYGPSSLCEGTLGYFHLEVNLFESIEVGSSSLHRIASHRNSLPNNLIQLFLFSLRLFC